MTQIVPITALFFGSFLLFGIQPMLGRTLLPPFGGSAAVWSVCLAAYQVLLLIGYGYAHVLAQRCPRTQRRLHLALLAMSVLWTFGFAALRLTLKDKLGDFPIPSLEVLFCVLVFVGLPYVLLSANSTLIQAWLALGSSKVLKFESSSVPDKGNARGLENEAAELETGNSELGTRDPNFRTLELSNFRTSRDVYKLYAVSNLGSLLGLLVYPFLLEPFVSLNVQWYGFAGCLLLYTVLLAFVARATTARSPSSASPSPSSVLCPPPSESSPPPSRSSVLCPQSSNLPFPLTRPWLWFALPALSTFLLNAVTMHLSTDVTPVPMMWVLLLTAFLLSYILGFSVIGEKGLIVWTVLSVLILTGAAFISGLTGGRAFLPNLSVGVLTVLICCTFLHGWLYRIRPDATHLTRFYLGIAAGGALGGVSASLVAPLLFNRVWEFPLSLIAVCVACAWLIRIWSHPELKGLNNFLLSVVAAAAFLIFNSAIKDSRIVVKQLRNFYGCLRVEENEITTSFGDRLTLFKLRHGETLHGFQVQDRLLRKCPTAYFGPKAGGLAITQHTRYAGSDPMRVGVIGLGAGTLACYGRTNDMYRFYEINPQVIKIASNTNYFTFIGDSSAKVEFSLGDARKRLEQECKGQEPKYDVLIVDAYSGDSVPFHLATQEAFQLYLNRLAPAGILAVHISNWHIDLLPLCKAVASVFELNITGVNSTKEGLLLESHWVFLTRSGIRFASESTRNTDWQSVRAINLPTDELGSLLPLIRFGYASPAKGPDLVSPRLE